MKIKSSGFTLIELLLVFAIISLLSSFTLVALGNSRIKARDTKRMTELAQIRNALELYYLDKGYYPPSDCGWDCSGYRYSYESASWNALATELSPYIAVLPSDAVNSPCPPWNDGCYSYAYGNVGRNIYSDQYDLTAQFENPDNLNRCGLKNYRYYFNTQPWCLAFGGTFSNNIYEASSR